jgi:hypothetical protein
MKKLIIMILLLATICFASTLKHKTFEKLDDALNFIETMYWDSNDMIGGNIWWSTHRLIVIPKIVLPSGEIINRYVVYWKDKDDKK